VGAAVGVAVGGAVPSAVHIARSNSKHRGAPNSYWVAVSYRLIKEHWFPAVFRP